MIFIEENKFDASFSGKAGTFDKFYLQIIRDLPDKIAKDPLKQYIAQRRFIYCWEKKSDNEWVDMGLMVTDDDGMLCNLQNLLNDLKKSTYTGAMTGVGSLTELKVNKYNIESKKWEILDWDLFGDSEDIVAFQKWLGQYDYGIEKSRFESTVFHSGRNSNNFSDIDNAKYDDIVFRYSFYAPEKYICSFNPQKEYVLVYCPPDIISNPETFRYSFDGTGSKKQISILPFNSSNFSCKFLKKPSLLWSGVYEVQPGDNFELIAKKLGFSEWRIIYDFNKKIIGSNPNSLKPGTKLKLPFNDEYSYHSNSCFISLSPGSEQPINNVTSRAHFSEKFKSSSAVLSVFMSPNFEEYLSMLSYYVCIFDIETHQLIQSFKPYLDIGSQVQNISMYLELMLKYPGFRNVQFKDGSIRYSGKYEDIPDNKKNYVSDYIDNCNNFCEKIKNVALSEKDNFAFKYEKQDLLNLVDILKGFLADRMFIFRSQQWMLFNSALSENNNLTSDKVFELMVSNIKYVLEKPDSYNSNDKKSEVLEKRYPVPVLYRIIQRAFTSVFMFGRYCGEENKIENFYKETMLPYDAYAELFFIKNDLQKDAQKNIGKVSQLAEFYELAVKYGLIDKKNESLEDLINGNMLLGCEALNESSVLEYIFNDIVFQKIAPGIWNNQFGPASYIDVIQHVSTKYRCSFLIKSAHLGKAVSRVYSLFKIHAGNLLIRNSGAKVIREIEISVTQALREKGISNFQQGIKSKREYYNRIIKSAPKSVSAGCSILQLVFCLRDILSFYEKYKSTNFDSDSPISNDLKIDIYNVYKSVHSGAIALTGFDYPFLKNWKPFNTFARIGSKVLTFGSAASFIVDGFIYWGQCELYHRRNEELLMCLRGVQALVSFGAASYLFACFIGIAPAAPVAIAIAGLIVLSADIFSWLARKFQSGIETVIKQTIDNISNDPAMKGEITVTVYDLNYTLCSVVYEKQDVSGKPAYRLVAFAGNTVWKDYKKIYQGFPSSVLKSAWETIENGSGNLPFWNLEVIPAGRELKTKGYQDKDIAFLTMKREKLFDIEIKKINGDDYMYSEIEEYNYYTGNMYSTTPTILKYYILK